MSADPEIPLVAIVGRANVGKSTLFNRISGKRRALVSREPGMTRDRRFGMAEWCGRHFQIVDTGGLEPDQSEMTRLISEQVKQAIRQASVVLFVVDGREGITAQDLEVAAFLRKTNKPVVLLVNKLDVPLRTNAGLEFHELGFQKVFFVSAEHGLNVDEVLDALLDQLNLEPSVASQKREAISVAVMGKPNVGKSTFLNALLGEERLVTSEIPGTTRDTIDVEVQVKQQWYRFIDTAGIRKKGQTKTGPDKLAVVHARKSLERADVACIMIDGAEGVTHQDLVVAYKVRSWAFPWK